MKRHSNFGSESGKRIMYKPGRSILHRLHPLVKAAWLLLGTMLVFIIPSPWLAVGIAGSALGAFYGLGTPLRRVRGSRLFVTTALLLGGLQLLFVREGEALVALDPRGPLGPFVVTDVGFRNGIYIAARFLSVVLLSYLFVLTTEPNDLAYAFMHLGLPYRYGFALITALRLVPIFEQEGQVVYHAQLARGVQYDTHRSRLRGLPRRLITLARQFFMPMLVSALAKVDTLAVSMEGRCFGKFSRRTFLREVRMTRRDVVALILLGLTLLGMILWVLG
jgi:energy-coupling factor transport system permease protein